MNWLVVFPVTVLVLALSIGEASAQPKQVIIFHSLGQHFQPWASYGKEIRKALGQQSPWSLDIQDYSLVTTLHAQ